MFESVRSVPGFSIIYVRFDSVGFPTVPGLFRYVRFGIFFRSPVSVRSVGTLGSVSVFFRYAQFGTVGSIFAGVKAPDVIAVVIVITVVAAVIVGQHRLQHRKVRPSTEK